MRQLQLSKRPDVYGGKTTAEWLEFLQSLPNPFPAEISAEHQVDLLQLLVSIAKQYLAQEPDMEKLVRGGYVGLVRWGNSYEKAAATGRLDKYGGDAAHYIRWGILE